MASENINTRRRHSPDLKASVIAQCEEPGASVAKVAMSHGINANVVHRWRQLARRDEPLVANPPGEFVSLPLPPSAAPAEVPPAVRVELRRGQLVMSISWPAGTAAEFAAWTRELLR